MLSLELDVTHAPKIEHHDLSQRTWTRRGIERALERRYLEALQPLMGRAADSETLAAARAICTRVLQEELQRGAISEAPAVEVTTDDEGLVFGFSWVGPPRVSEPGPATVPVADGQLRTMIQGEHFANRLRITRKARGLSPENLAARAGVSKSAISAWETGKNTPTMGSVARLAEGLGLNPHELDPSYRERAPRGQYTRGNKRAPTPASVAPREASPNERPSSDAVVGELRSTNKALARLHEDAIGQLRVIKQEMKSTRTILIQLVENFDTTLIPLLELLVELRDSLPRKGPPELEVLEKAAEAEGGAQ